MTDNTHIQKVQEKEKNVQLPDVLDNNIKDKLMAAGLVGTTGAAVYGTYNLLDNNNNNTQSILPIDKENEELLAPDKTENDCTESLTTEVSTLEEVPVTTESNSISFEEAFRDARKTLGENATFEWNGNSYNTKYQGSEINDNQQEVFNNEDTPLEILPDVEKIKNIGIGQLEPHKPALVIPTQKNEDLPDLFDQSASGNLLAQENIEIRFGKLDTNNDGKWDTIVIDRNNDGKVDIMAIDDDNDGKFDTFMINDNNDGTLDRMMTDVNHIGIDRNDIFESISYEIDMNDYDQVNENEPGFDQFDILGGLL